VGVGAATLEVEEGGGYELELLGSGGAEVVERGGALVVLLGKVLVLVEEVFGISVVVVVGTGVVVVVGCPLPKSQVPDMTPWSSVPPKKWKRPVLKSKSPGPQLSHLSTI